MKVNVNNMKQCYYQEYYPIREKIKCKKLFNHSHMILPRQ